MCIVARFEENMFKQDATFGYLFPFLENSFVANQKLEQTTSYCLPKLVQENQVDFSLQKLQAHLNCKFPTETYPEVHISHWSEIFQNAKKGVLYIPATMSKSADAYVFWNNPDTILAFQLKSGGQHTTETTIVEECQKIFEQLEHYRITLVVVPATYTPPDKFKNKLCVTYTAGEVITGTTYHIPPNAQVIVLCKAGLAMFFSSYNLPLLQ